MPAAGFGPEQIDRIRAAVREAGSITGAARLTGYNRQTVAKYGKDALGAPTGAGAPSPAPRLPAPAPEAGGPTLPDPVPLSYAPFSINAAGHWLVINDLQMPFHDVRTINTAFREARERNVAGVLFNGDILDCADLSDHCKQSDTPRIEKEIEDGEQFFAYARSQFPRAQLVWKIGNHEERLPRFLANNVPELMGLQALTLPNLLHLDNYGVQFVQDGRVVHLGRLPIVHGHEFGPGAGGVNPARWLFLRTNSTAMCAHFHRTSEHHERGLDGRLHGVWSVGCACYLHPRWRRLNKWNHGYAFVNVASDGHHFEVTNRRILPDGRVV